MSFLNQTSDNSPSFSRGNSQYTDLTQAYPEPSLNAQHVHPQQWLSVPPEQRPANASPGIKMQILDDSIGSQFYSNSLGDGRPSLPSFQHLMKRQGDKKHLREILGNQYSSGSDSDENADYQVMSGQKASTQAPVRESFTALNYVPKMHVIGGGDQGGYNVSSVPISQQRRQVYEAILSTFPSYVLTKTDQFKNYGVYKAPLHCLLCVGVRIVVAVVKNDGEPIGTQKPLSTLPWDSFQTRTLEDDNVCRKFRMESFPYLPPTGGILTDPIKMERETNSSYIFKCDNLPLMVEVLKSNKINSMAQSGTLWSALELFNTVLTWESV